ncbi:putative exo-1,4-beta-xylosidase bxlB [Rhypophila decipiens]|uniref:xylan 1,4-beta-xylosidase n=1 Tax=Rhypophila decipiens TaxID=261697 RepID=A0AAN6XWR2_9PEZI|nr:putative exo-1,4-beta-xylosidase bxlB [Rhypophila decipiens]
MKLSRTLLAGLTGPLFGTQGANGFTFPDCVNGPLAGNTVCDTKASPSDRAAALVKAMTANEKLANLVDNSKGAPRLGLPSYQWWNEGLHGVAASPGVSFNRNGTTFGYATSFANAITLASAFDDELVLKVGEAISTEARAFINAGRAGLEFWTPNINPYKDPRWGRGAETPGEDPFRVKGYTAAIVAGLEGNQAIRKVIATCKHYAAYDLERWKGVVRYAFNAIVSMQDLTEYYLPPFQQCARDSKAGSIMCSYNALNGTPACANTYLMNDILREHWGWTEHNNFITSDCNAIKDFLPDEHNYSSTPAEAAAVAYTSGTDTVCEVPGWPPFTDVIGAYNQTLLSEATIDTALRRLYEGLIRAGYFDPQSSHPYGSIGWSDVNTPEHQVLALQTATDGAVLLKNINSTLPISLTGNKSIALVGHWAGWATGSKMLGPYSGIPPFLITPEAAAILYNITYYPAPGPVAQPGGVNDSWTNSSLSAAAKADIIIYCGGTDMSIASEDKDRESIAWPASQLSHIETLASLGKPVIVAQLGDQVDDSPLLANPNISAVLWMGYPGQAGGLALFDILTGRTAPAGRLAVTQYPAEYVDQVPLTEMALRPITGASPGRTYRWYDDAVLPFGHGQHYTSFSVGISKTNPTNLSSTSSKEVLASCANKEKPDLCVFTTVPVSITNTGKTMSDYVALLFLRGEFGPKPYPIKTLVGYKRLRAIKPGETREAAIEVKLGELARRNEMGDLLLYGGKYEFVLGVEGLDEGTAKTLEFQIDGEEMLERFPQPKN